MKYMYTATFTPDENGLKYYARIPDLPGCITTGSDLQDAIRQITDAAIGWIVVAEDEGLEISPATPQDDIPRSEHDILSLISIDTTAYRSIVHLHGYSL
jgi:predicted RNase H-like HicB family nuclease